MHTPESSSHADSLPEIVSGPLPVIESYLARTISGVDVPAALRAALEYAALGGGKRLRPLLVWHACAAAGGRGEDSLPVCAAIEFVHCFSLVHDDLPALDDDDLRRGRPTLHLHAGEAMAILAGDALLNHAFRVLSTSLVAARASEAITELSRACERMISGQVLDTLGFAGEPDAESLSPEVRLEAIHRGKTGAMIVAAIRMGALCGRTPSIETRDRLTRYGEAIGLMFQIVDDVLDVTQHADHTGKRTGKDAGAGKLTYPGVVGLDRSRELVRELESAALGELSDFGPEAEPLRALGRYLAVRTR